MRFLFLIVPAVLALSVQADEELPSRFANRLSHLHGKQSWQVLTTQGVMTIDGKFGGIANGSFFIQDQDGLRHEIPIDAVADDEHRFLTSFRDRIGFSLPGEHQRRMQNEEFADYVYRRETRYRDALVLRRDYNASKGPARGWTAISVPFNAGMPMGNFIQQGWVAQPAIPQPRWWHVYTPRYEYRSRYAD